MHRRGGAGPGVPQRSALTAARFVPDPYGGPGERLYRTADRARWRPAGTLEFLGRLDDQVKIRGFRVEPEEVRTALLEHPAVAGCAVTARTDLYPGRADLALAAYLTPAGPQPPTAGELRRFAAARLPAHMVPAAYLILPRLPLTPSGKVDRAALPAPALARPESPARAPATPTERALASLWQAVLGLDHITADDDFFALGGHSLLATQVISRIRRDLGTDLPLRRLFEHPTIASLAAELDRTPTTPPATHHIKPAPRETYWAPAPRRPGRPDATRAATGEDADPG